jgi:hypothetical protein
LLAEAISATEIALSLSNIPAQGRLLRLERSLDGTTNWRRVTGLEPNAVEYVDSGLIPDTVHYYRVRISRDAVSNIVWARTLPLEEPALAPPASLQVSSNTPQQVELAWTDQSEDESGFVIERSLDGLNFTTLKTVNQNVTSMVDGNLSPATYYYRVRSYRGDTHSDFSEIVSATINDMVPEAEAGAASEEISSQPALPDTASEANQFALPGQMYLIALAAAFIVAVLAGMTLLLVLVRRRSH